MRPQAGQKGASAMARDLVCGIDVDPATAAATCEYNGKTYYFCAKGCKKEFDSSPGKYAEKD